MTARKDLRKSWDHVLKDSDNKQRGGQRATGTRQGTSLFSGDLERYSRVQARAHGTLPALLLKGKAGVLKETGQRRQSKSELPPLLNEEGVYSTGVGYSGHQRTTRFSNAIGQHVEMVTQIAEA